MEWPDVDDKTKNNGEWRLYLWNTSTQNAIGLERQKGPYAGAKFIIYNKISDIVSMYPHTLYCSENYANGFGQIFQKEDGAYCQKLFNGKLIHKDGVRVYALP